MPGAVIAGAVHALGPWISVETAASKPVVALEASSGHPVRGLGVGEPWESSMCEIPDPECAHAVQPSVLFQPGLGGLAVGSVGGEGAGRVRWANLVGVWSTGRLERPECETCWTPGRVERQEGAFFGCWRPPLLPCSRPRPRNCWSSLPGSCSAAWPPCSAAPEPPQPLPRDGAVPRVCRRPASVAALIAAALPALRPRAA